jgi:hypothetical protein
MRATCPHAIQNPAYRLADNLGRPAEKTVGRPPSFIASSLARQLNETPSGDIGSNVASWMAVEIKYAREPN